MSKIKRLPQRNKVKTADTWDLSKLFSNDEAWEKASQRLKRKIAGYKKFSGNLGNSATSLAECLKFDSQFDRLAERLGNYAYLKTTENQTDSVYQRMLGRYQNLVTHAAQAASFIRPEILSIPLAKMKKFLAAREMKPYRLNVERLLRFKKHTLGKKEEELLAMQGEMAQAAGKAFRQLLDADLKFGLVSDEKGNQIELSNATFSQLLLSPRRSVRRRTFHQYYEQFAGHENTLAAMLGGSAQKDIYYARARSYDSSLAAELYGDNMPLAVYDNLIASVRRNLPALHRYYDLRRRKMKLKEIHQYDTYTPILNNQQTRRSWNQAVELVIDALAPLGSEYCRVLNKGLLGRWSDRYPNAGKQSGAFSYGVYDGDPYILMNYKPTVLNDVFTLAHEAGHSMHTYFSTKSQPYEYYNYTIFVAEVASTFNEQLLSRHLLQGAKSDSQRANLINNEIDDIRATIFRQTMFAEFEKIIHEMAEAGEPLTVQAFKTVYHKLLVDYFGPDFTLDDCLPLECFRIPHFYRAFYVYKYATGMSAAIALSQRVVEGGKRELDDYHSFLNGGCSKFPLDLLCDAGVDMRHPEPVDTALKHFSSLVDQLDDLL